VAAIAIVLVVGQVFPAELTILDPYTLRIVDEHGNPLEGIRVEEAWGNTAVQREEQREMRTTGLDGMVSFPARVRRVRLMTRIVGTALAAVESVGVCRNPLGSYVFINVADSSRFKGAGFGGWYGTKQKPSQLVLEAQDQ